MFPVSNNSSQTCISHQLLSLTGYKNHHYAKGAKFLEIDSSPSTTSSEADVQDQGHEVVDITNEEEQEETGEDCSTTSRSQNSGSGEPSGKPFGEPSGSQDGSGPEESSCSRSGDDSNSESEDEQDSYSRFQGPYPQNHNDVSLDDLGKSLCLYSGTGVIFNYILQMMKPIGK